MRVHVRHGLIESAKLIEVGRINAICGRNNSGKSTLLRAFEKGDFEVAERLVPERAKEYGRLAATFMSSGYGGNLSRAAEAVERAIAAFAGKGGLITSGSNSSLKSAVESAWQPQNEIVRFNPDGFLEALQKGLPTAPKSRKIVPAERILHNGVSVTSGARQPRWERGH